MYLHVLYVDSLLNRSKAGKHVSQSSEKYVVTPQNNAEQGSYSCKGVRTERPSYSKDSSPFATKNLREYNRGLKFWVFTLQIFSLTFILCLFIPSFEEEGASFHLRLSLLWHDCCRHWMHCPQSHPQTRFYWILCVFLSAWILKNLHY